MTERAIGVPDTASGAGVADYRVRERSVGGTTVGEQYVIPVNERVATAKCMVGTFRIVPAATTAGLIYATLWNAVGSGLIVAVRAAHVHIDYTTNSGTVRTISARPLTAAPTGGTLHTPTLFDTAGSHSANVEFRGGASADATLSAITATPGAGMIIRQLHWHIANLAGLDGQIRRFADVLAYRLNADDPFYLHPGEGVAWRNDDASSTSTSIILNCVFEEFTLP